MKKAAKFSLGARFSMLQAMLIFFVMAIFTLILTNFISQRLEKRAEKDLSQQVALLVNAMSSYHSSLADSAGKLCAVFHSSFPGAFTLDTSKSIQIGDKQTPTLTVGGTTLNLNTEIVDRFTSITKAVGTVFVRSGDDFIRICTSLKKEDGNRAVGTPLDSAHPAYQGLLKGEEFTGKAFLFGKDYVAPTLMN